MSEYMILGLRLTDGITEEEFEERFGESLEKVYGDKLEKLVKRGLLISAQEKPFINQNGEQPADGMADRTSASFPAAGTDIRYKLTPLGLDLANQVFVEFI
jgi:oxygen-independent coproporphyrinogen-3 oxidase